MSKKELTLYTNKFGDYILATHGITLDEFKLESGFFEKVNQSGLPITEPVAISYAGRNEMVEVLKKCYKIQNFGIKPYIPLLKDHKVETYWNVKNTWLDDHIKSKDKKEDNK